jgi:hypothetical protein
MLFVVSLEITLMRTFISGEMGQPIGKEKNVFGSKNNRKNGLKFCPKLKTVKLNLQKG